MSTREMAEALKLLACEKLALQEIALLSSVEFAEQAADILNQRKHCYGFTGYLRLLKDLVELLTWGIPQNYALESVQTGLTTEIILQIWSNNNLHQVNGKEK